MEEEIRENSVSTETVETTSIPEQKPQIVETPQQEAPLYVKEWNEIFSEFFTKIGMIETSKALLMELIVLSTNHEKQIPNHIDWLLKELTTLKTRMADSSSPQSAKRKIEPENGEENPAKKVQMLMNPQEVQIRTTNSELEQRIDNFIQLKKSEINDSNRAEFLRKSTNPLDPNDEQSCARSDAAEINRNIQMKLDVVNNEDGPLARSTFTSTHHNRNDANKKSLAELPKGVEERLQNIEKHLKAETVTPVPLSVYERLKVMEDKIIQLERDYPPWSAIHFNQPNRQLTPPVMAMAQASGNNLPVSIVTPTFPATPAIPTSSLIDVKRNSPSSINLYNSKNSRIAPRPIKPKGRGRGQSSLTRSVMEQLKLIRRTDNEKQNDNNNNGTFIPISTKPLNETSKSQIQMFSQLTPQLSKVQTQQRAPQAHQVQIQPQSQLLPHILPPIPSNSISQQPSSTNKLSSTLIPIAPKPPVQQQQQQQQQRKVIAEETQSLDVLTVREDRSISPIIDPGSNNETVPKEDDMVKMDAVVESNGVKSSHDKSVDDDNNTSTNTTVSLANGEIADDNVNNVNTTGLVSNIENIEELEQVRN